jgi:cytochrome c553
MRFAAGFAGFAFIAVAGWAVAYGASPIDPALAWAYLSGPKEPLPVVPAGTYRVTGSPLVLSQAALNASTPDWFRAEHPAPPSIVSQGSASGQQGCAECHNYEGVGFITLPSLAGLPADYIVRQVRGFRAGQRRSSQDGRVTTQSMIHVAAHVSDAEAARAATYFAGLPRRRWYHVVETATVPVTRASYYGWSRIVPGAGSQALGARIVEVAQDDQAMFWLSDPHSGVVVYAPVGSVARGAAAVRAGRCAACHGAGLRGAGAAPPIAGRSPDYLARAMWDIRTGARADPGSAPMRLVVARLSGRQITSIVAYLAGLPP